MQVSRTPEGNEKAMTAQLDEAFTRASALPEEDQDELARLILEMIEADQRWERTLATSQDKPAQLADEARAEIRAGTAEPLDPDRL